MRGALRHAASLLAASCVLAGCSGQGPPVESTEDLVGLPALTMPWEMRDCDFAVILIGVPRAMVAPYVPAGFTVQSVPQATIGAQAGQDLPNPANDGNLGLELFTCAAATGLPGQDLERTVYSSVFIAVDPPAALRRDVTNHFVKLETLVDDNERRELLARYGVPVVDGAVAFPFVVPSPTFAYQGTLDYNGSRLQFQGTGSAPLPAGSFAEFTPTPHGFAVWTMQYELSRGGAGVQRVTVPSGSLAAGIIGDGTFDGGGFAGHADFTQGTIELPAVQPQAT